MESLLNAVVENPRDDHAIMVYADWLEERGDARAEYLRLQLEFRVNPSNELRRRMIVCYPHDAAWTSLLEQSGVLEANLTRFSFAWWGSGIGAARDTDATYEMFRYEDQPPLPVTRFDGGFDWLRNSEPESNYRHGEAWREQIDHFRVEGFHVPVAFERFMTDADLPGRIKSCTDNYFTAPDPGETVGWEEDNAKFVTFYADSQWCVIWGILLHRAPGRYAPIVSGPPESFFDEGDEEDPEEGYTPTAPVLAASSLEPFLYRWWIENEIWFATEWSESLRELNSEEQAYVDHFGVDE